jgi:hypothetical protein
MSIGALATLAGIEAASTWEGAENPPPRWVPRVVAQYETQHLPTPQHQYALPAPPPRRSSSTTNQSEVEKLRKQLEQVKLEK